MVVVVFAPHTHTRKKKKEVFCFGPDDVTTLFRSIDRSIDRSFLNIERSISKSKRKQKKEEEKVPINNTNTTTTSSQVLDRRETPKDKEDARTKPPFREKNAEEKKREKKRQKEK